MLDLKSLEKIREIKVFKIPALFGKRAKVLMDFRL